MSRHRVTGGRLPRCLALTALTAGLTACGGVGHHASPAPVVTVTRSPTPGPTVTVLRTGVSVRAGATAAFRAQAGVSLRLRASRPSVSRHRLSPDYGYAPARGYYVTFTMTITNTGSRSLPMGPSDFYVRVAHQGKVTTVMGNAPYSGASEQLDATQLDPGQSLSGPVTFDVRGVHGVLAFAPDGSAAVSWTY